MGIGGGVMFTVLVLLAMASMHKRIGAHFRAWLIALIREAVRAEFATWPPSYPGRLSTPDVVTDKPLTMDGVRKFVKPQPIHIEPSFEQMQAEAIQAQVKHYEPKVG